MLWSSVVIRHKTKFTHMFLVQGRICCWEAMPLLSFLGNRSPPLAGWHVQAAETFIGSFCSFVTAEATDVAKVLSARANELQKMQKLSFTKEEPSTIVVMEIDSLDEKTKNMLTTAFSILMTDVDRNAVLVLCPWNRDMPIASDLWCPRLHRSLRS